MLVPLQQFLANLARLQDAVGELCAELGRDSRTVAILPVTKNHPAAAAEYAFQAGLRAVGENRVQEARDKRPAAPSGLQWELIGHLQSNKAKVAVSTFDRIQSVDNTRLLDLLDRAAAAADKRLRILVQVNAGRDPAKFGCEPQDAPALVEHALSCAHLELDGLMTIAPLDPGGSSARATFERLRELRDELAARFGRPLPELSMGMSDDWPDAIRAGSTLIRIGTALFGARV